MAAAEFGKPPSSVSIEISPFKVHVSDSALEDFKQLLQLSPVGTATFENSESVGRRYGVQHEWLINAKDNWLNRFDWRAEEERINVFPHFTATVDGFNDENDALTIHFIALFSQKRDAVPLVM